MENRTKEITLGMAVKMALHHIHWDNTSHTEGEFDEEFKKQSKRFYGLIRELQKELIK